MLTNFMEPEEHMITKIKLDVPELLEVGSISDFHTRLDEIPSPSLYIQPEEDKGSRDISDGAVQVIRQYWILAAVVAHDPDDFSGPEFISTTKSAGQVLAKVSQSLVGWKPAEGWLPFRFVERMQPIYDGGYGDFPALFETGFVLTN